MKSGIYRRRLIVISTQLLTLFFPFFLSQCLIVTCANSFNSESWDDESDIDIGNVDVEVEVPLPIGITDYYENPNDNNIGNDNTIPMEGENEISWGKKEDEDNSVKKMEEILSYVSDMADATNLGPMLHKEIESTLLHKNKNKNKHKNKNQNTNTNKTKDKNVENDNKKIKNKKQKNTQNNGDELDNLHADKDKMQTQTNDDTYSFDKTQHESQQVKVNNKPDKTLKLTKQSISPILKNEAVDTKIENIIDTSSNNNHYDDDDEKTTRWKKKLKIPKGSTLSVSLQITRPNVLPGIFYQPEGIVMDAVIEIPVAFHLDVFAEHVYSEPPNPLKPFKPPKPELPGKPDLIAALKPLKPEEGGGERSHRSKNEIIGYERCFLYNQLEIIAARTMEVTQDVAHACILRTICELHSLLSFKPHFKNASVLFELIRVFFTPSLGVDDKCFRPYLKAEKSGRKKGLCYSYATQCPISFTSVIITNFVPIFAPRHPNN